MIKSGSTQTETRFTFLKTKTEGCDATRQQNDVILGTHQLIDSRILTLKENHPIIPDICHFFLHGQNFWRIKFTLKKRVNYVKIHSKLPIVCVITAKYTVNYQFFALNL